MAEVCSKFLRSSSLRTEIHKDSSNDSDNMIRLHSCAIFNLDNRHWRKRLYHIGNASNMIEEHGI
ncbi:MAG: hypothetical protein ACRYFL_08090 [Janthinobacterium lividum]